MPASLKERVVTTILVTAAVSALVWMYVEYRRQENERLQHLAAAEAGFKELAQREKAPENELAYLDSGKAPADDDINATRIRYLLNYLAQKTGDTPAQIADLTIGSTITLRKDYGK